MICAQLHTRAYYPFTSVHFVLLYLHTCVNSSSLWLYIWIPYLLIVVVVVVFVWCTFEILFLLTAMRARYLLFHFSSFYTCLVTFGRQLSLEGCLACRVCAFFFVWACVCVCINRKSTIYNIIWAIITHAS